MKLAIIMRGLPGSGKSTLTRQMSKGSKGALVFSADAYHIVDGEYRYDPEKAAWAHSECLRMFTLSAVADRPELVVDNTNATAIQMVPYIRVAEAFGYNVEIMEMKCSIMESIKRNTHGVPEETICRMAMELSSGLPKEWKEKWVVHEDGSIEFEQGEFFGGWLGQAHPPKEVQRYSQCLDKHGDESVVKDDHGGIVYYEDVKEYLLNGD